MTTSTRIRPALAALLAVATLGAAACGGGSGSAGIAPGDLAEQIRETTKQGPAPEAYEHLTEAAEAGDLAAAQKQAAEVAAGILAMQEAYGR